MHRTLILNTFSTKAKLEKTSVFLVRGRVLMVLCRLFMLRMSVGKTPYSLLPLRTLYHQQCKNEMFLSKSIDSTKMNC